MSREPMDSRFIEPCAECRGTGMMEIVMPDLSREPWPCFYCEAGARIREQRSAAGAQGSGVGSGDGTRICTDGTD